MKRTIFRFLTIFAVLLCVSAAALIFLRFFHTTQTLPEDSSPEIESEASVLPVLNFCELVNDPEKYDGKTVRLSARLSIGLEGSWFSDTSCGADNAAIISAENNEVWKAIDKARARKKGEPWDVEVDVVAVGKFKNVVYKDWCCLTAPFQFEILKVEKASKVN